MNERLRVAALDAEWLSPAELGAWLGMPVSTLCDLRKRPGEGPPFLRVGRSVRYHRPDVIAFLEGRKTVGGRRYGG